MFRYVRHRFFRYIIVGIAFFAFFHLSDAYKAGKLNGVLGMVAPSLEHKQAKPVNLPGHSLMHAKEAADPSDCAIVRRSVPIYIDPSRYPATAKHVRDAIKAGEPKVLHLDREAPDENRKYSLAGVATKPGDDRDEYPPAATMEGGEGANIRLIPSSDNRGAGSSMGAQLSGFCSGQAFVLVTAANPN